MRFVVLINLAILVIGVVLAELIFGNWIYGPPWGTLNIPRSIERQFDVSNLYLGEKSITYRRDSWGLRGHYDNQSKIDILTIGGSTTDQRYIDDSQTWQELLRKRYAQNGKTISVVNAGIDGQSTVGHLAALQRWLPHIPGLKSRYILAYIGINDIHIPSQTQYDSMESPLFMRRLRKLFENNSAIFMAFKTIDGTLRARRKSLVHGQGPKWTGPWAPGDCAAPHTANQMATAAYKDRVLKLIDGIRAYGAEAIIVTQNRADYRVVQGCPLGITQPDGSVSTGMWAEQSGFNDHAMEACKLRKAICLDLGSELTFGDHDFYDWVHTNPSGNERIADYLYQHLSSITHP